MVGILSNKQVSLSPKKYYVGTYIPTDRVKIYYKKTNKTKPNLYGKVELCH